MWQQHHVAVMLQKRFADKQCGVLLLGHLAQSAYGCQEGLLHPALAPSDTAA